MTALDYLKAFGVAFATIVITVIASFPMVAFYAYLIEPGHPQEFYTEAAQWIAPWSSYVLGPVVFFVLNYWLARRTPARNALLFAVATLLAYVMIELAMVRAMGGDLAMFLSLNMAFWFALKVIAALAGAHLGSRASGSVAL